MSLRYSVPQHREGVASMQTNGTNKEAGTSVQVALRIRPVTDHDQSSIPARWQRTVVQPLSTNAVQVDASGQAPPGGIALAPGTNKRQNFTFDRVLGPSEGQEQIYNHSVMPLIGRFLEGYNVTILAYGQTSSGKSYTMGTALSDIDFESLVAGQRPDPQTGIIPRAVAQIFSEMKTNEASRSGAIQYTAKASFIEIYNEELIDLLADGDWDNRPLVQIREDKAGNIIWSGLKEVRVQSVADVMNRLLQGSSIRRTNETDMNAQSSRSHAIFSLTLTQRKYTGGGAPPPGLSASRPGSSFGMRSGTPTGRNSALPRPSSSIPTGASRLTSPIRSNTPGGGTAFGLRPTSVMSSSGRASPIVEDRSESGEWVTVTSKFHFVDLAGSERLKRTAAQGERVKEGISINAGLHALGNVISALGDPSKSKRTTHVPYRDSKLTRLLQDSLGGNAHTLMIACVSPTEYNVSETVNTLQYANRARNIKNKAEINEIEIGWDDVDYLQGQVTRLRKEMQLVKGFKVGTPGSDAALRAMNQKEVLEWQAKYATLSQKFSQLTVEATRLQQQTTRENKTPEDYYKAAEPIIIEYEKTVDQLEGQINLQKAALGHSEDIIMASETRASEQEEKLAFMENELEVREETVVELQARLTKLEDREATSDSYARDLESRLAAHNVNGVAEATVVAEMRQEITRLRGSDGTREQYIKDLESRLAKAEEGSNVLQDQISRLEREVDRREEAYKELQQRLEMMDNTQENKQLVKELDARDANVMDLQVKLDQLQSERDEIARERGRLIDAAATRQLEKGKLEDKIRELESKASSMGAGLLGAGVGAGVGVAASMALHHGSQTAKSKTSAESESTEEELAILQTQVEMLTEEVNSRQEASTTLQTQMQTINIKYKDALAEIQELNSQLSDARSAVPETPGEYLTPSESPSISRKTSYNFLSPGARTRGRPESLLLDNTSARRQSLSRRSSNSFLGYNPKESTFREGTMTPTTSQASQQAAADGSPTLFRTRSLSQSLGPGSSGKRKLSLSGSADFAKLGFAPQSSDNGLPSPGLSPMNYERKIASLEAEAIRLQEVLRERDEEIVALERQAKKMPSGMVASVSNGSMAFPVKDSSIGLKDGQTGDVDELMRAMARKETESRLVIEQLTTQMQNYKKEREASQSMMENQITNMGYEIEVLRQKEVEMTTEMEKTKNRSFSTSTESQSVIESLQQMHLQTIENLGQQHSSAVDALKSEHESKLQESVRSVLSEQAQQHGNAVKELQDDHASVVMKLQSEHGLALAGAVEAAQQQHLTTLGETETEAAQRQIQEQSKIKEDHIKQVEALNENHVKELEGTRSALMSEHSAALDATISNHSLQMAALSDQHQKAVEEIHTVHADNVASHEATLVSLRDQHDQSLSQTSQEHTTALQTLREEHTSKMDNLTGEHETAVIQLKEQHSTALSQLQEELQEVNLKHVQSRQVSDAETNESKRDLERLQQNHLHTLEQLEALKSAHSERLRALTDEHVSRVEEVERNLHEAVSTRNALAVSHEELQAKHTKLLEQDPHDVDALRSELAETNDALVTLEAALTETQIERDRLLMELQGGVQPGNRVMASDGKALAQSQKEVELLQSSLANVRSELQRSKSDIQGMLEGKTRQESALREMQIKVTIAETRSASQSNRINSSSMSPSSSSEFSNGDPLRSPAFRRESTDQDSGRGSRSLGIGGLGKPPPLTPPPNVPPPPTPSSNGATTPTQQRNSVGLRSSTSSSSLLHNRPDSPNGLLTRSSSSTSMNSPNHINGATDPKTAKVLSDQAEELRNLAKQLNHCEMDLQANIDLVATLEAALNDSERNLRKSRLQLSESTRERDRYAMQVDELRSQVSQAQQETDSVRNSVMVEKQSYESRLQKEREAKEKARRALEARLDEVQKKKNGKLFCM